jgi:hypothetical protein
MRRSTLFILSMLALQLSFTSFFTTDVSASPGSEVAPYTVSTNLFHDISDCGCQVMESMLVTAFEVMLVQTNVVQATDLLTSRETPIFATSRKWEYRSISPFSTHDLIRTYTRSLRPVYHRKASFHRLN